MMRAGRTPQWQGDTALALPPAIGHIAAMLHLMKLAVGARDIASLERWQKERLRADPPLRHRTRSMPRRAAEIVDGGSLYWVVSGAMVVRQRVTSIVADRWDDGAACAGLVLDPVLVALQARLVKPFQGWRYLAAEAAPPDLQNAVAQAESGAMPDEMRRELLLLRLL